MEEWYPPGLPARDRLAWYAERFDAVEVNSTFYAVREAQTVRRWVEGTPGTSSSTSSSTGAWVTGARGARGRAEELAGAAANVRLMFDDNRGADAPRAAERMKELVKT